MATIRVIAEFEVSEENPDVLARSLVEYLTSDESVLHEDFGPDAWGGYDGSKITSTDVSVEVVGNDPYHATSTWEASEESWI